MEESKTMEETSRHDFPGGGVGGGAGDSAGVCGGSSRSGGGGGRSESLSAQRRKAFGRLLVSARAR